MDSEPNRNAGRRQIVKEIINSAEQRPSIFRYIGCAVHDDMEWHPNPVYVVAGYGFPYRIDIVLMPTRRLEGDQKVMVDIGSAAP